jgi:hypothetical protein
VLSVPTVSGQQEAQKLAARPVAWATHPLLARPALRPVSVLLEGVVPPVLRAQLAPTPLVGHSTHAPAALQAPPLPAPAMMILLIASVSQGNKAAQFRYHRTVVPFICESDKTRHRTLHGANQDAAAGS